jgi:hypothetical protein
MSHEIYIVKVYDDGTTTWNSQQGKRHRLEGPAVEYPDGGGEYWVDGKRHRLEGPAVEYSNGGKEYWVDGELHRLGGPAVEYSNGHKEYWVDGEQFPEEEWKKKVTTIKLIKGPCDNKIIEVEGKKYRLTPIVN